MDPAREAVVFLAKYTLRYFACAGCCGLWQARKEPVL